MHLIGLVCKEQQCKKATREWNFNSISGQRWKLERNNLLKNKAGIWKSEDSWTFTTKDNDFIYIEKNSWKILERHWLWWTYDKFAQKRQANERLQLLIHNFQDKNNAEW